MLILWRSSSGTTWQQDSVRTHAGTRPLQQHGGRCGEYAWRWRLDNTGGLLWNAWGSWTVRPGNSWHTRQHTMEDRATHKVDDAALTSHFDSGKVSPGFSAPAGQAEVGDLGSAGGMGMGWLWPSELSGARLDLGWPITGLPVGVEHEDKKPAVWEQVTLNKQNNRGWRQFAFQHRSDTTSTTIHTKQMNPQQLMYQHLRYENFYFTEHLEFNNSTVGVFWNPQRRCAHTLNHHLDTCY